MAKTILETLISVKTVANLHLLTYVVTVVRNHIIKYQRNRQGEKIGDKSIS